jgi:hypothetical protein
MESVERLFATYTQIRGYGYDAVVVLDRMKDEISRLSQEGQAELVKRVRQWERDRDTLQSDPAKPTTTFVSQAQEKRAARGPAAPAAPMPTTVGGQNMVQCQTCGRQNVAHEVYCFSCGTPLKKATVNVSTRPITDALPPDLSHYDELSTLVLVVRETNEVFRVRPQDAEQELIIGRSDGGIMQPDIDLADHNGAQLGVSRLHLGLRFDPKAHLVSAADLNSANGSFVNGQRLFPSEVRALRHGDELRLGRIVLQVYFHHPKPTIEGW